MRHEKAHLLFRLALEMQGTREGLSLDEIGERCGVGRRTAMRLRDALLQTFPQMEESQGADRCKRWHLPKGTLNGLAGINADELAALDIAMRLMAEQNRSAEAETLRTLSGKLKAVMRPDAARRIEPDLEATLEAEGLAMRPGPRPRIDTALVGQLRTAIKACRKVTIRYYNRNTGKTKDRLVHPYGFLHGHRHYLVAWHENPKANDFALFSLPGIREVRLETASFARDAGFDLQAFAARSFGLFQEKPFNVVWRFAPEAAAVAADFVFHPSQSLEWQKDGSLIVRFHAGSNLEMAWHLYSWGDKVEVLEPPVLAALVNPGRRGWTALP